ncbi:DMT family transporter [Azohydromonas caseinilytica]|uniref:DMT family transporter n=1 Tax=Azohydromonas caseinilytica TaxID=2728836 RepID=A0A848F9U5_9BURK|nr:DMT family transporter [Azohydromonas caseinilytica]NML15000.1 DMT family transporter [Azohydromonas caseinilytica]
MPSSPASTGTQRAWPGLLLAATGAAALSGKAIIVKLSYRYGIDAVTVIMLRMLFALPLFLFLAWWAGRGQRPLTRRDWLAVGLLGFSGYYLSSFLDFMGLQYVSAGLERLVLYLNPTLVLLLSWLLFGRRATWRQFVAMAVSYAGVVLAFGQEVQLAGPQVLKGTLLVLGSAVSYALYLVYAGEEVRRLGAMRLTGLATSVACLLCVAQFLVLRPLDVVMALPPEVVGLSLINATVCTFAPVLMLMLAIERVGPTMTAQAGMIGPLTTIAMGVLVLGEPFSIGLVAGTALVLAGVALLNRWRK